MAHPVLGMFLNKEKRRAFECAIRIDEKIIFFFTSLKLSHEHAARGQILLVKFPCSRGSARRAIHMEFIHFHIFQTNVLINYSERIPSSLVTSDHPSAFTQFPCRIQPQFHFNNKCRYNSEMSILNPKIQKIFPVSTIKFLPFLF